MHKSRKCSNYQYSTLTRHVTCREHWSCLSVLALQRDLEQSQLKVDSQQDKAALVLFKTTYWMAQEGVSLSKFGSLRSFMASLRSFLWCPRSSTSTAKSCFLHFTIHNHRNTVQYDTHFGHCPKEESEGIAICDSAHR